MMSPSNEVMDNLRAHQQIAFCYHPLYGEICRDIAGAPLGHCGRQTETHYALPDTADRETKAEMKHNTLKLT